MKLWKVAVFVMFAIIAVMLSLQVINRKKGEATSTKEIKIKGIQVNSIYNQNKELMLDLRFELEKPEARSNNKKCTPLAHKIEDIIIVSDKDIYPSHPAGSDISGFFTHQSIKRKKHSRSLVKESEEMPIKELLQRIDQQAFFNHSNRFRLYFKQRFAKDGEHLTVAIKLSDGSTIVQQSQQPMMAQYH